MKHIAIYIRVSTRQQSHRGQKADLKRWAESQDGTIKWYTDTFTGKTMDRPGWTKLQAAIERGEVSAVVVWRLDRLGRTAKGLTALFDDLLQRDMTLISLKDHIDLSTPSGRLMANMLASVAQFETEIRAERALSGQAAAKAAGKSWGGRKAGTRIKLTPAKERTIRSMKAAGESVTAIAATVELSRPTVYGVLNG